MRAWRRHASGRVQARRRDAAGRGATTQSCPLLEPAERLVSCRAQSPPYAPIPMRVISMPHQPSSPCAGGAPTSRSTAGGQSPLKCRAGGWLTQTVFGGKRSLRGRKPGSMPSACARRSRCAGGWRQERALPCVAARSVHSDRAMRGTSAWARATRRRCMHACAHMLLLGAIRGALRRPAGLTPCDSRS